jgi:hypothetical protein
MIMSFLTFVLVLFVIQFLMNTTSIELQSTQEVVRSDYDKLSSSTEANTVTSPPVSGASTPLLPVINTQSKL